ncbi:MAG: FAD-dependent oxidoreductase [Campylobacterales bacterium]|nr:FAD-dependent oxidoreductase [Campylobacterales bacterium]
MGLNRRDVLKVGGLSVVAAAIGGCGSLTQPEAPSKTQKTHMWLMPQPKGNRVVVVGGGFGGLALAKSVRQNNPESEVVVLERRDLFFSCPFSNTYLGELDDVDLGVLTRDYYGPAKEFGYRFVQCEVVGIDRAAKTVSTSLGDIEYDVLVLSPGIAYAYDQQFPQWDASKISRVAQEAPAAMIAGSEHLAFKRQLEQMDDGDVVITVPFGKYRCPPAPYERACMIAHYMEKEGIEGKVIILDAAKEPQAKAGAFKEAFNDLFKDRIVFVGEVKIKEVDVEAKEIVYTTEDESFTLKEHVLPYQVLNLIPQNKANPVIAMAGIETNAWGGAKLKGAGFVSVSDPSVYVVGDCVGHGIPASGQSANWAGKRAGKQIASRLGGKAVDEMVELPYKNANMCYSMVGADPEEAVMVTHEFVYENGMLVGKGFVPKDATSGKFRTTQLGRATREWYRGIMSDMFGV